jgi:hypothetical protein
MTPHILELATKAGLYVDVNGKPWPRNMNGEDIEGAYQKFAELIVRECMEINKQELAFNAYERLINKYHDHFGVE